LRWLLCGVGGHPIVVDHPDVSAFFRHDRYGARRARVSRREREMQLAMEAERVRMLGDIEQKRALPEHKGCRRGWEEYGRARTL
jgi:hypothetical protein